MKEIIIKLKADQSFALGVQEQSADVPVRLYKINESAAKIVWKYDLTQDVILLNTGEKSLALGFQHGNVAPGTLLTLSEYSGSPKPSQRLSLIIRKGYITSLADISLVVGKDSPLRTTLSGKIASSGDLVFACRFNKYPEQQWSLVNPWDFLMSNTDETEKKDL